MVYAYVPCTNTNTTPPSTVSIIDTRTSTVIATPNVGRDAQGAAVTWDGTAAYISNFTDSTVSVIDTATNSVIATITVGSGPIGLAATPDGTKVYVANSSANTVSVINAATHTVLPSTISVGNAPTGVAITPDGTKVYVTNQSGNSISVIDVVSNSVSTTISTGLGNGPTGIAITPNGSYAYVANLNSGTVSVVDTSTNTVSATVSVGTNPFGVAITPDGAFAYVTQSTGSGSVSIIDTSTNTFTTDINSGLGSNPQGIAITPDGSTVYVVNYNTGSVSVIPTATNTVVDTIGVGDLPVALGIFIQPPSIPMTTIYTAPQGRLTLTSNTPVMTADATAQTSVYYTPYQGNIVPIYDGANMQSYAFGQLTMALNTSNQLSGNIYDLFVFINSSVVTIGAGPAWSSTTSRGAGAGTTQLQQTNGLWVNANSITLKNGSTSYSSIGVGQATYVGSVYMTANGQTGMAFNPAPAVGGANPYLGVYNAYNRVLLGSNSVDSTTSWTYTNNSNYRAANNSNSNRITFLDGLQQSSFSGTYMDGVGVTSSAVPVIGVGVDSTATGTGHAGILILGVAITEITMTGNLVDNPPLLGLHYVQALEKSFTSTTTYYGGSGHMQLSLEIMT